MSDRIDPADPHQKGAIFGVDLGTSNSCVSLWANGKAEIIRSEQGARTTPSVVAFSEDKVLLGAPAQRQAVMNPTHTISEVKRLIGQKFGSKEVSSAKEVLPYEIVAGAGQDAWTRIGERTYSPQEIQGYLLAGLMKPATEFLGTEAKSAIITVPAFFDDNQRQAVRDSAAIAGVEVVQILNEPTAAALAYGYGEQDKRKVCVIDLGGGTMDVTIMSIEGGRFCVLATDGDNLLGGADFDRAIARHLAGLVAKNHGIEVNDDPIAMQRLLSEAERAKKELSHAQSVEGRLPYLAKKGSEDITFEYTLKRDEYVSLVKELCQRIALPCSRAMKQAKLTLDGLDDVLLVGGMTRSFVIKDVITQLFKRAPLQRVNPDEAVAIGASILGATLSGKESSVRFVDVVPGTIGVAAREGKFFPLLRKSTPLPASVKQTFRTTKDNQEVFELPLLTGESPNARENRSLATVQIGNLPPMPKGECVLEVELSMRPGAPLDVRCRFAGNDAVPSVQINPASGLPREEVEAIRNRHLRGEAAPATAVAEASDGFSVTMNANVGANSSEDSVVSFSKSSAKESGATSTEETKKESAPEQSSSEGRSMTPIVAIGALALCAAGIAAYFMFLS